MDYVDYAELFPRRLTELRINKGVSARDMSLSLGQSESYINKIENRHTLPSLQGFFYICEYLGITPSEFFNTNVGSPAKAREIAENINKLTSIQAEHIMLIINDMTSK
ncbi:MAG: helix-turn-helix transcriptional regulator [Clostridiales bacterium]|nr:helix-turn-helix transcriptional regulator [Clostridiales bacterium]